MWVVTGIQRTQSFIYKYRYIYIHHPYILNTRVKYMYQSKRIVNKKWSSTTHSYISGCKHSSPYNSVPVLATTNSTWPMISVLTVSTENWIVPQCTIIRIHTRYTVQYTILYVNLQHMLHFVVVYYKHTANVHKRSSYVYSHHLRPESNTLIKGRQSSYDNNLPDTDQILG